MGIGMMSCLLVVSVVGVTFAPVFEQNRQEAEAIIAIDPSDIVFDIMSQIWNAYQWIVSNWIQIKEQYLDPIVWNIINLVLQNMMRDITQWIATGFAGRPAFLQDPGSFLTGIADRVVGDYLNSTELGNFLCSPWRIDVRGVLALSYQRTRNTAPTCTISGIWNNAQYTMAQFQQFVDGAFNQGGWDAWFQFTQNPQYNPHGAVLLAQEQLGVRISNTKGQEYNMVLSAQNFLSSKVCTPVYENGVQVGEQCQVTTPGSTIEKTLNEQFASGKERLHVADEFNELLAAFFTQMVQQALAGGTASTFNPSSGNYYYGGGNSPNVSGGSNDPITDAITSETAYRDAINGFLNRVLAQQTYKDDTYGAVNTCHPGTLSPALIGKRDEYINTIAQSNTMIGQLTDIRTRYQAAVAAGRSEEQNTIMQEFLTLQGTGRIHTAPEAQVLNSTEGLTLDGTAGSLGLIPQFRQQVDAACNLGPCGSGGGCGP